jgi:hypothetical protein
MDCSGLLLGNASTAIDRLIASTRGNPKQCSRMSAYTCKSMQIRLADALVGYLIALWPLFSSHFSKSCAARPCLQSVHFVEGRSRLLKHVLARAQPSSRSRSVLLFNVSRVFRNALLPERTVHDVARDCQIMFSRALNPRQVPEAYCCSTFLALAGTCYRRDYSWLTVARVCRNIVPDTSSTSPCLQSVQLVQRRSRLQEHVVAMFLERTIGQRQLRLQEHGIGHAEHFVMLEPHLIASTKRYPKLCSDDVLHACKCIHICQRDQIMRSHHVSWLRGRRD